MSNAKRPAQIIQINKLALGNAGSNSLAFTVSCLFIFSNHDAVLTPLA
jgi:hypothetical protein